MKLYISILFVSIPFASLAMENTERTEEVAFFFDMGKVISTNADTGSIVGSTLLTVPKLLWRHPIMVLYAKTIADKGQEIAKTSNGIGNVLEQLNLWLQKEKYGKLSQEELEGLLSIAVSPTVHQKHVVMIQDLGKTFPIGGAVDQDILEHLMYQQKMKKVGVIIPELFKEGIVTVPTLSVLEKMESNDFLMWENNPKLLVAKNIYAIDASNEYLKTLKHVAAEKKVVFFHAKKKLEEFETETIRMLPFESLEKTREIVASYEVGRKLLEKNNNLNNAELD